MNSTPPAAVAQDWSRYQQPRVRWGERFTVGAEKERYWWAVEKLMDWCNGDPELCWATIVEIWSRVDHADLDMLAKLGAGPVEDLLCDWGVDYFPVIEEFCDVEPDFKTVLRMVWQSSMSPQLWQKVQGLRGGPNL